MSELEIEREHRTLAGDASPDGDSGIGGPADYAVSAEDASRPDSDKSANEAQIACWLFRPNAEPSEFELHCLPEIVAEDENLAWVDVCDFTERQLREIASMLRLQKAEVYSALSAWSRPRLETYGDHFYVSTTVARLDPQARRVLAGQMDLFVGANVLVSLHKLPLPFATRILTRARHSPDLVRLDSAYLLYIVLDELLAYYEDLYEEVQAEVEGMEERALTDTSDSFLADLIHFKRYTTALVRLAGQHRQVFGAFRRPDFHFVSGAEIQSYYRDLENRLMRVIDTLEAAQESVNGSFNIYVSHVSHRTNQIIKVLTIVSTILLPISVIVNFFATSFHGIPIYTTTGLVVMLAAIAGVTGGILLTFWRRGWL